MRSFGPWRIAVVLVVTMACSCSRSTTNVSQPRTPGPESVNAERLVHADQEAGNWFTYGRTYNEQRFSPLKGFSDRNINQFGLAWSFDLDTHRGQEATPIVVDGVMYFTSAWSKVFALDAATGALL